MANCEWCGGRLDRNGTCERFGAACEDDVDLEMSVEDLEELFDTGDCLDCGLSTAECTCFDEDDGDPSTWGAGGEEISDEEFESIYNENPGEEFRCPNCGEIDNGDVTIKDHGECYGCHQQRLAEMAIYDADSSPCPSCGNSVTEGGVTWIDENGLCVHCAPDDDWTYDDHDTEVDSVMYPLEVDDNQWQHDADQSQEYHE